VRELPLSAADCELVRSIIAMAASLGLSIVGEGVEENGQWDFLKENGCTLGQGYLFSRPVAAQEFRVWLESRKTLETAG
jgi:EAL domain-containing protein (putative c-di-GMP-specific phosphodiesterase class I)